MYLFPQAEYSDLKTLWHRVNDAIDTIIRRDESSETGELLQPCIEGNFHLNFPFLQVKINLCYTFDIC